MKKNKNNLILLILLFTFLLLFFYNDYVKEAILVSSKMWFYNLVPFMFPMYIITDLLLNYGLGDLLYKIFKKNYVFLIVISILLGTPSNAKYISEFYKSGYIDEDTSNWLLLFAYSPNPLFILGISPNVEYALVILGYIYMTNVLLAFISRRFFKVGRLRPKIFYRTNFSKCIESSINKSFNILILILGIISIYSVINTFVDLLLPFDNIFLKSVLEMTNALHVIKNSNVNVLLWIMFASTFAGLSIHTQIKSILEDTSLSFKYFFLGRLLASLPILVLAIIY